MELTVQNIFGLLMRSRLVTADDSRAIYQRWHQESGNAAGGLEFARWLVTRGYVTEYQANLLLKGHAEGFFIDQYQVLERIGKGRMAGVYKAVHESGQVVAIKVLPPSRALDPMLLGRFQREARLALLLRHPNIVRSFQLGEGTDLNYFVMELLEGETLEDVLQRRGKFPPAEAARLVYQALLGLQHIHEQGLVHRDLKPANLMLVPAAGPGDSTIACTVKILDIGLGRALFDEAGPLDKSERADAVALTATNVLLGTPDYMSPEQARDARSADIRSDIYSVGCVLYHLLTGQPVFPDTNVISQMVRHATELPRPLREFNPAISDDLQQVMYRLLAKDPAQRYASPQLAAEALHGVLTGGLDRLPSQDPTPQMRKYLTWLESSGPVALVPLGPAAPLPEAVPLATPVTLPPGNPLPVRPPSSGHVVARSAPAAEVPSPAAPSSRSGKRRQKDRERKQREVAPLSTSAPKPTPSPAPVDVELFSLPAPPVPPPASPFRLAWRDLGFFGLGVLGTCLAFAAAFLAARLLH